MSSDHQHGIGEEYPRTHLVLIVSPIIIIVTCIIDAFVLKILTDYTELVPLAVRIVLFLVCLALAFYLMRATQHTVFVERTQPTLVTNGVYGFVRHPMYLSQLMLYLSFVLLAISIVSFTIWLVIFFIFNRIVAYEEKDLERILKEEYIEYKKQVARWIPLIY